MQTTVARHQEQSSPSRSWALTAITALALGLPPSLSAQQTLFASETAAGTYDLLTVDESSLETGVAAQGIEFLPVQLAGYSRRDRLRADLPRLAGLDGPAVHVRLPSLGSLYRVHKTEALAGTASTRLLLNRAAGGLVSLGEVSDAAGAPALQEWLTTNAAGTRALLATTAAAGGDVLLVDLEHEQPWVNLTAHLPPLDIAAESLRLEGPRAWFVAGDTLYRVALEQLPAVTPAAVDLGFQPGESVLPETLLSRDGRFLAVVTENPLGARQIYVAYPFAGGKRLTETAGVYDLPSLQSPIGPLLALSDDGGRIAYRQQIGASRELFTRRVASIAPAEHVTRDGQFIDTIDNVGILGFATNDLLVFGAGEGIATGATAYLDGADVFVVSTTGIGGSTVPQNVTQSSGQASAPFVVKGELSILGALVDPLGQNLLLDVDADGADHEVVVASLTGGSGYTTLVPLLDKPPVFAPAGNSVLILTRPRQPQIFKQQIHLLQPGVGGAPPTLSLLAGSSGPAPLLTFARFASSRGGDRSAFVASVGTTLELPGLVDVPGAALAAAWSGLTGVSPEIAFSPSGRLTVGLGNPGGPYLFVGFDGPSQATVYPLHPAKGFPLDN